MSQKYLAKFGSKFYKFGPIILVGDMESDYQANQDAYHIAKKLKNLLYDLCVVLRLGRFNASLAHLIIIFKKHHISEHGLTKSDLDYTDKMNYK
jgi:hypothetical protein